jgi:hypothetical protein
VCLGCKRYFLETHGTPFHSKQGEPDKLVWAISAMAEGLGIRAVARVFKSDPTPVVGWLVEAADHLEAFSRSHLRDLHVEQVQSHDKGSQPIPRWMPLPGLLYAQVVVRREAA